MTDEGSIPKWLLELGGAVVVIFGIGRAWGALSQRDTDRKDEIELLRDKVDDAIEARDAQMEKLTALFTNETGEPRFITYPAHDIMQLNCQKVIAVELAHIKETCDEIKMTINRRREDRRAEDKC